ncbi:aspartic proteinase 39-like isoform X2 [Triticum dicoccoides]|nr:aspartic proteinase 39-like isoform X2 [Triticum dicoccoides]
MNNSCSYYQNYGDGYANTAGFFVSDTVKLGIFTGNETSSIYVTIIFGCSHLQSGGLTDQYKFDGIFGFGPSPMSFNSQLHSLGLSRKVFSLCMKSYGGGILVLGEVVEPGLVYTPLLSSTSYYGLNLEGIAVNGKKLLTEPSVFEQSHGYHTIADSGTTLAFLADKAFDPFVTAIASAVSQSVRPIIRKGVQCFITSDSVNVSFPSVTLFFAGAAVMQLKPHNYLVLSDDQLAYCIAWQRGKQLTILGGSYPVNITTSSGTRHGHIYTFSIIIFVLLLLFCYA